MLLTRLEQHGHEGGAIFKERVRRFARGDWLGLLQDAERSATGRPAARQAPRGGARPAGQPSDAAAARAAAFAEEEPLFASVIEQVKRGELSRAAKKLVASPLAPGNQETLGKLTDPRRRPTQLFRPIREEDLEHVPERELVLDKRKFMCSESEKEMGRDRSPKDPGRSSSLDEVEGMFSVCCFEMSRDDYDS